MRKTSFIFAGIISAVIGNAYATDQNTVTSKSYVDAMDATKQDAITARTSGNVVTYNGTDANGQAQFSEKGIYSGAAQYTNSDSDKLITAGVVHNMAETLETLTVPDNKLTCYNQAQGCTLWQISTGTASLAAQGTFAPLTAAPACKQYNETASSASQCCSGVLQNGTSKCGCNKKSNCRLCDNGECMDVGDSCNTSTHVCVAGDNEVDQ